MSERLFVHDVAKWKRNCRSHEIESAQVRSYENAIVLPMRMDTRFSTPDGVYQGGVCSPDFEFIAGHVRRFGDEHTNWNCDSSYEVPQEDIVHRNETVVFGGCLINHFGHALLEGTSRLWWLPNAPQDAKIVFLRYPRNSRSPFDALKFVELMGFDMNRVEVIDRPTQFRKVIVPDETIHPMNAFRAEFIRTFDQIRQNIEPKTDRRIYLSRRKFNYRTSLNEEYYEGFFARHGYTVIYPETLPIEEQIAYVAGADEIVTMIGSMAHLLLFAKPTATATILNRSGQCLTAQIIVDQARGIEPYYVDAYINPLPVSHVNGPFLFGPNRFFQAYLDARGIDYEPEEVDIDGRSLCSMASTFIEEWARLYADPHHPRLPGKFHKKDIYYYGEDYMRTVARLVDDDEDNPDDFLFTQALKSQAKQKDKTGEGNADKEKLAKLEADNKRLRIDNGKLRRSNAKLEADAEKAIVEVARLRSSKSWKITAPLRKVMQMLGRQ